MGLESGEVPREILILVSGDSARPMAMESILGSMVTDIKVNSKIASNTEKEFRNLPMVIHIEVPTKMVNLMAMESTFGVTVAHTKAILKRVSETVREFGKNHLILTLIPTMASFSTKKNKVMVFLHGPMAADTQEVLQTISGKVMVKCTGAMAMSTKVNGTMELRSNKFHNLLN